MKLLRSYLKTIEQINKGNNGKTIENVCVREIMEKKNRKRMCYSFLYVWDNIKNLNVAHCSTLNYFKYIG